MENFSTNRREQRSANIQKDLVFFVMVLAVAGLAAVMVLSLNSQREEGALAMGLNTLQSASSPAYLPPAGNAFRSRTELISAPTATSHDLSAFTKWTAVLANHDSAQVTGWNQLIGKTQGLSIPGKLDLINRHFNKIPYISDMQRWGKSDYWEIPAQFVSGGGDCEDYAIAKYFALRAAGFDAGALRLIIVRDLAAGGVYHSILSAADADGRVWILDNQNTEVIPLASALRHYAPIYSINEERWWAYGG